MKPVLSAFAVVLSLASPAAADPLVGFDRLDIQAKHRSSPLSAAVWYPTGRKTYAAPIGDSLVFEPVEAYIGAALPDENLPLIVVSHGSGSSIDGTAWLAAGLAGRGAMVLVMNHPGTTSGDSSPRRTVRLSDRSADMSASLDAILSDPAFSDRIDSARISALGFSLGGAAVLGIAGVRFDANAYANYCQTAGDAAQDCLFLARGGVDLDALPSEFSADMADPRFTSIVAIDPGFTYAATANSAASVNVPVQIVSLGDTYPWFSVDVRAQGSGLIDRLADVEHAVIPNAFHYSFLPICNDNAAQLLIEEGEDPICDDPDGWDRATAHAASIEAISRFLDL
ncbi:alpha/beta hydrolase family protein [Pelagibacterium sp.]|uniref:alpha/beta hydrolase family protein n=1 Tax=Pelagibacterium sp. TaxID=1967288 RepID=UPI003A90222F